MLWTEVHFRLLIGQEQWSAASRTGGALSRVPREAPFESVLLTTAITLDKDSNTNLTVCQLAPRGLESPWTGSPTLVTSVHLLVGLTRAS